MFLFIGVCILYDLEKNFRNATSYLLEISYRSKERADLIKEMISERKIRKASKRSKNL